MVTQAYQIDAAQIADIQVRALALKDQGVRACRDGDHCRARQVLCDALVLFEFIGDRRGMAEVIDRIGVVRLSEGQAEMATSYFQRASMMLSDLGEGHLALKTLTEAHAMLMAAEACEAACELAEEIARLHEIV